MQLTVTVKPGTSQEKVIANDNQTYTVYLRARAHDGEANVALIKLLSKHFHVPKTSTKILRGQSSRHKLIQIAPFAD